MKVSEYEKELRINTTAKHGARYDGVIDALKDFPVKEAVQLLNEIKIMVNRGIDKKLGQEKLEGFIEKKATILT